VRQLFFSGDINKNKDNISKLSINIFFVIIPLLFFYSTAFAQIKFTDKVIVNSKDSIIQIQNASFYRIEIYAAIGVPYIIGVGGKWRFNESWFIEVETPYIVGVKNGYIFFAVGMTTTNYVRNPSDIYLDGEAAAFWGNFGSWLLAPHAGNGVGLTFRGNIRTKFGLSIFLKIGGAALFNGHGYPIGEWGIGFSF
jgi:hypothetical protein